MSPTKIFRIHFRFCGNKKPTITSRKGLKVLFSSNKKGTGAGAQCRVWCEDSDDGKPWHGPGVKFSCPNPKTMILQTAYNYTITYSWEQCGNLCYLSERCTYWSFFPGSGNIPTNCFLFDDDLKYAYITYDNDNDTFSGDRNCPGRPKSNYCQALLILK